MKWLAVGMVAVALAYIAYPYWCLHRLAEGFDRADAALIDRYVVWPELRTHLKREVNAQLDAGLDSTGLNQSDAGSLASGLARLLLPGISERLVDHLVTPEGLAALITQVRQAEDLSEIDLPALLAPPSNRPAAGGPAPSSHDTGSAAADDEQASTSDSNRVLSLDDVAFAFFTAPTRFQVDVNVEDSDERLVLVFRLDGLVWRLFDLALPKLA
ncbi:MAG: DUF2939 domain-containing protein [Geminicoccaceae bacterium]